VRALNNFVTRGLTLVLLLIATALSGAAPSQRDPAAQIVKSYRAENVPLVDALLRLGQQQEVPFGIEYIDLKAVTDPITVATGAAPVGQVLDAILERAPGYSWSSRGGVICISHSGVPVGGSNLLDHVLSDFSIPKMSMTNAALALDRSLYMDLHPGTQGWAGSSAGEVSKTEVGPYSLRDVSVREVLNRIVKDADAAWLVQVPPGNLSRLPSYGLWRTVQYESPPKLYAPLFRGILLYTKPDQAPDNMR